MARMRLLQIDTIHLVARSPCLVLFSRLGAYPMDWLDEALAAGQVFETWAHEACFAPVDHLAPHRLARGRAGAPGTNIADVARAAIAAGAAPP